MHRENGQVCAGVSLSVCSLLHRVVFSVSHKRVALEASKTTAFEVPAPLLLMCGIEVVRRDGLRTFCADRIVGTGIRRFLHLQFLFFARKTEGQHVGGRKKERGRKNKAGRGEGDINREKEGERMK